MVALKTAAPRWPGAQRLRAAREKKGWTEADLARAAGLDVRAIKEYEKGTRAPSAPTLLALAGALGVSPDRLWPTAATYLGDFAEGIAEPQPRERWSVSKLTTYLICPAKYYFQYVAEVPEETPTTPEAVLGSAVHAGIEALNRNRMGEVGQNPAEAMRMSLDANLPHVAPDPETGEGPDRDALLTEANRLFTLYATEIAPKFIPAAVEQRTEVEIAGVPFTAVLDVVTQDGWIRDTKTSKRRPSQDDIDNNLQATVYTLAYRGLAGEDPQGVAFDYLIRTKTPTAETYPTTRSQKDFDRLARIVEGVTEAVERRVFYPNPNSRFGCAGCQFRDLCRETF